MIESEFYIKQEDEKVKCTLCPHYCILKDSQYGICKVRYNKKGELYSENYMKVCSMSFDAIEKKPLYHFYPGKKILSLGTVGCNFSCKFCQNFEISQCGVSDYSFLQNINADEVLIEALSYKENCGVAFTYNEPIVGFEFVKEMAMKAKSIGLKTVMITNGFINEKPLRELLQYIDAFNVDLKAFNNEFYRQFTGGSIDPVKESLKIISESNSHLEITNLIIPSLNDNPVIFSDMIKWIKEELGINTPLHLSGYFPRYKLEIKATSGDLLRKFYNIAMETLSYVYIGNVYSHQGSNTICPICKNINIERVGYVVEKKGLLTNGQCDFCGNQIINSDFYEL